ncbi:TIM44-like domain-containing protein [Vibrio metschnikovii]|nr:TIM44-like domain-containing protein [Vibrio metschnikovii]
MKRLFSFMALLMITVMVIPDAEARRMGGGKSFGQNHRTAPAQNHQQQQATPQRQQNNQQPAATNSRGGLMGGLMGGLLAGGLLAAFFGGAFEGIQFMDILIFGLIGFALFKLARHFLAGKQGSLNPRQPAYNTNVHRQSFEQAPEPEFKPAASSGFGSTMHNDVPHNYPPGFDKIAFINGSREHYRILQGAWNHNQLETIEEYVSESLFADLKAEREKLDQQPQTEVMYVDAEIVRADYDDRKAQLSLQFTGRCRDLGSETEEEILDIWHLERDLTQPNAPWLIVGIQG